MSEPTVITLDYPVEAGGETIRQLTLRRPRVKDMKAMMAGENDFDQAAILVSRLSDQPLAVIENLDAADFERVNKAVADFLPDGRATGRS